MFKETKDGQTHYENDGCGEPFHNKEPMKENCNACKSKKGTPCKDYRKMKNELFCLYCGFCSPCHHPAKECTHPELLGALYCGECDRYFRKENVMPKKCKHNWLYHSPSGKRMCDK